MPPASDTSCTMWSFASMPLSAIYWCWPLSLAKAGQTHNLLAIRVIQGQFPVCATFI
jgi:hypothetical protein